MTLYIWYDFRIFYERVIDASMMPTKGLGWYPTVVLTHTQALLPDSSVYILHMLASRWVYLRYGSDFDLGLISYNMDMLLPSILVHVYVYLCDYD